MKKLSPFSTLALAAVALAAAGCASVNTVEPAFPAGQASKIPDKRIITNKTLNDIAYTVEVDKGATPSGLAMVQVQLQNTTAGEKNIAYRFTWFDANGIALNTDPVMKSLSLEGGEMRVIQDVATSPNAVDWKLSLYENASYSPDANVPPSRVSRP